jgi:hypothetical protein
MAKKLEMGGELMRIANGLRGMLIAWVTGAWLGSAEASPFKLKPRVTVDPAKVLIGNPQHFQAIGLVDRDQVFDLLMPGNATRENRTNARYRFRLVEANDTFRALVRQAALERGTDCVAVKGFVEAAGLKPIDLTPRILTLARARR